MTPSRRGPSGHERATSEVENRPQTTWTDRVRLTLLRPPTPVRRAIVLMSLTLAVSIIFFVEDGRLQFFLVALGIFLAVYLYRIPSRDESPSAENR